VGAYELSDHLIDGAIAAGGDDAVEGSAFEGILGGFGSIPGAARHDESDFHTVTLDGALQQAGDPADSSLAGGGIGDEQEAQVAEFQ